MKRHRDFVKSECICLYQSFPLKVHKIYLRFFFLSLSLSPSLSLAFSLRFISSVSSSIGEMERNDLQKFSFSSTNKKEKNILPKAFITKGKIEPAETSLRNKFTFLPLVGRCIKTILTSHSKI